MLQANEFAIYTAIKDAIMEQKLRPSMQLVEEVIAESFGVSRTPVRNVFRRLASEKLVTVIPYKGTFVSCPTIEEAKEVFEMRRVLEGAAIRHICRNGKTEHHDQYNQLKELLHEECQSHQRGDLFGALGITKDFHLHIARMAGNSYYNKYLEELISLTYVIIAFYGKQKSVYCNDHRKILAAIEEGDEELAERLMLEHLKEIENVLDFAKADDAPKSLVEIFDTGRYVSSRK